MKHLLHFVRRPTAILLCGLLLLTACTTVPQNPGSSTGHSVDVEKNVTTANPADTRNKVTVDKNFIKTNEKVVKKSIKNDQKYADVWQRIRAGYALPELHSARIRTHEEWFGRKPEYIYRMSQRARLYLYYIAVEAEKRGMPMEIAMLPA